MSEATVQWHVKAAGRDPGDIETFELDSVFAKGLLASGYITIVDHPTEVIDLAESLGEVVEPEQPWVAAEDHPESSESLGLVKPKSTRNSK